MYRRLRENLRLGWALTVMLVLAQAASGEPCSQPQGTSGAFAGPALRVLTLNLAHGRKDGRNQLLQSGQRLQRNLAEAATLLRGLDAEVIALQEVDAASLWSGRFDQLAALGEAAGYPCRQHGLHARSPLFAYGTALMARAPFRPVLSHSFQPSPPTFNKGFVLGELIWRPGAAASEPLTVDLVSVHLDFSRRGVRVAQVAEMIELLSQRSNPLILMGDFNSDWFNEDSAVRMLAVGLGLRAYRPEATDLGSYPRSGRRLDWILISEPLAFAAYRTLELGLSDHHAVLAELRLKPAEKKGRFRIGLDQPRASDQEH